MKVKSLSVVLVAAVSLTACQSSSVDKTGAVKDVWAGKVITPVTLSAVDSLESRGKEITYKLSKQSSENRVRLLIDNSANLPLQLNSVTISGAADNPCVVQAASGYQLPGNKLTVLDLIDIKAFENCVYGTNKVESGRYQISINHDGQFSAGVNTRTSSSAFIMTIDYSVGVTQTVSNLVGFTYFTTGI